MIKAIVFDMDGVLIDSEPIHGKVVKKIFDRYGIDITEEEHQQFIGGTSAAMWAALKDRYNLSVTVDRLLAEDQQAYLKKLRILEKLEPVSGAEEIMAMARNSHVKLALASSSTRANVDLVLSKLGYMDLFQASVSGDEVTHSKPHPQIIRETARKLDLSAETLIVIEDSENGVKSAKEAGARCIGYRNHHSGNQNLNRADWIISDLKEALPILKQSLM